MREKNTKTVDGFPEAATETLKRLDTLAALPDSEIDTSDIPEWTDEDFANAIRLNGRSIADVMELYKVRKTPMQASTAKAEATVEKRDEKLSAVTAVLREGIVKL